MKRRRQMLYIDPATHPRFAEWVAVNGRAWQRALRDFVEHAIAAGTLPAIIPRSREKRLLADEAGRRRVQALLGFQAPVAPPVPPQSNRAATGQGMAGQGRAGQGTSPAAPAAVSTAEPRSVAGAPPVVGEPPRVQVAPPASAQAADADGQGDPREQIKDRIKNRLLNNPY